MTQLMASVSVVQAIRDTRIIAERERQEDLAKIASSFPRWATDNVAPNSELLDTG